MGDCRQALVLGRAHRRPGTADAVASLFPVAATRRDETAAILFTTGSTGPAKGAVYTHGNFDAQLRQIQTHSEHVGPMKSICPRFPCSPCSTRPWASPPSSRTWTPPDPPRSFRRKIIEAIVNQGVTNMFASPALLNRVGSYGRAKGLKLPSLKRVISAGAPVAPDNIEQFAAMLTDGAQVHTPYGATEAVPIISIASDEILSETRRLSEMGYGYCIGRPINDIPIRIIRITDAPIHRWSADLVVEDGQIGEIAVQGDLVTRHYFERPEADAQAKIADGNGFWHRMGDLGWRDKKGRIWFCGRKSHRVITENGTLYTVPCESIFNNHHMVYRSALAGVGAPPAQKPVICVELEKGKGALDKPKIKKELLTMASRNPLTEAIDTILFHDAFPVDIRHNSKIFREQLAVWAGKKLKID